MQSATQSATQNSLAVGTELRFHATSHEHIGSPLGKIGLDAFRFIMRDRRFDKIPKVLETPKGKDLREDMMNMKTLRALAVE